jgi:spore maturation protein CgeB
MIVLNVNCLHSGDWVFAAPQFREEIKREGKIVNQFPAHHNGAWMWTQALRDLGHEVVEFDYRTNSLIRKEWQARFSTLHDSYNKLCRRFQRLLALETRLMNERLLAKAKETKPDVFITYPGERILPKTIREMSERLNIRTVLWLGRDVVHERTANVVESFPFYDFVFTIDPPAVDKYKRHGARNVYYLPLGCYPPTHRPVELTEEDKTKYSASLSFVGQLFDDRPEFLCNLIDEKVNFWTHWWDTNGIKEKYPQLAPFYRGEARGLAMIKVLNGADIVLNVHRAANSYEGTNMRTFEAAGCAAFQITEYKKEIGRMFKIDEEIAVYYDMKDLKQKIGYYLRNPELRSEMARQAQRRAYAEHTYQHRFEEMLKVINNGAK